MKQSLRALLAGAIDYAGLFPPAELSLDESIRNYARYQHEPEAWMLGRFICPAVRLKELEPYLKLFEESRPLSISALGRAKPTAKDFRGFRDEFDAIGAFEKAHGTRARITVFEAQIPDGLAFAAEPKRRELFLESVQGSPDSISSVIRNVGVTGDGFKLRTGGVEASAFPSSGQIAMALAMCREHNVPIKFTAGLHHPIRHFNPSVNTKMHGFINVLVAGALAHAAQLGQAELTAILEDEDPADFHFDDEGLAYKSHRATTDQVGSIRRQRIISFGSCSFDEPRDDLRALEWL